MQERDPYRWIIFLFLFSTFTLQFSTYLSWNPFIPLANHLFGFTASQSASIVASVALGRMLFQIPGGIVVDIYSAKKLLIISMLILAASTSIVGLDSNYVIILIGQFLIGMSGVVICPLCIKLVIAAFPADERDFISGMLNSAAAVAVILTNSIIPFIIHNYGWNMAFYAMGFACLFIAILIGACLKIPQNAALFSTKGKHKKFQLSEFTSLIVQKRFLIVISVHAGAIYTTWGINSWLAMYLSSGAHISSQMAGQMMFLFGIFGCLSMALAGRFVKGGFRQRCFFLLGDLTLTIILALCIPFIHDPRILWIYISFLGIVNFAHFGPLNIFISNLIENKFFATALAISIFLWQIASIIQSLIIGKILDNIDASIAYFFVFFILSLGALFGSISLCIVLHKGRQLKKIYHSYRRRIILK